MAAEAAAAAGSYSPLAWVVAARLPLSVRASASSPVADGLVQALRCAASGQAVSRSPALAQLLKDDELRKLLMEIDGAAGCAENFIWMCS